ncbi:MAG: response regulator [Collinsella sp.]|nr:response regulator [Collinsella sp.]
MLKIIACDDDVAFLDRLHRMIDRWSTETGTAVDVALVTRGEDLLARHAASRADIILLDMIMPLVNGMDTARELRQADTAVRLVFPPPRRPSSRWNPTRSAPSTICSSP